MVRSKSNHPPQKKHRHRRELCFSQPPKKGWDFWRFTFWNSCQNHVFFFSGEVSNGLGIGRWVSRVKTSSVQGNSPSLLIQKSCQLSQLRYRSLRALNRRFNLTPNSGKIWPVDWENVLDIKKFLGHLALRHIHVVKPVLPMVGETFHNYQKLLLARFQSHQQVSTWKEWSWSR